jgi:hypothetical protein
MHGLKGKTIICAFPNKESWKRKFRLERVTWTEDDDKCFVEGIVSGDTELDGISVVAQDNPKWCLIRCKPCTTDWSKYMINELKSGYCKGWIYDPFNKERVNVTCPY